MNETISGARPAPDNPFESSARAMSEFVIRVAILPVTMLFSKPRDIAEGAATGDYRLLPTPFLLALITGVVISGVTSNLDKLAAWDGGSNFVTAVTTHYARVDASDLVGAFIQALPYIFVLWAASSVISLLMWRGVRESQTMFAALAWTVAAYVAIIVVGVYITFSIKIESSNAIGAAIFLGSLAFALILAVKVVRLVLALRQERKSPLAGAIAACVFAFVAILMVGNVGAVLPSMVFQQRAALDAIVAAEADGRRTEALYKAAQLIERNDYANALAEYDTAIAASPAYAPAYALRSDARLRLRQFGDALADADSAVALEPENADFLNTRCWVRAVWGEELEQAVTDCNESLRLRPDNAETLDSRALAHLRQGNLEAALADYEASLAVDPKQAHALYGHGIVRLRQNDFAAGQADLSAAKGLDANVETQFTAYGLAPSNRAAAPPATP